MQFELPSLPNIDDNNLGVTDFIDFSTYTACSEKYAKYSDKTLKLNSSLTTGKVLIDEIRILLRPILGTKNSVTNTGLTSDINLDLSISRITDPKINPLPKCLADVLIGESVSSGSTTSDILTPSDPKLQQANTPTTIASGAIQESLDRFLLDKEKSKKEVYKILEKTIGTIVAPEDKDVFYKLDYFQKFIKNTYFTKIYREWKDDRACILKNCSIMTKFIANEDFLYYDTDHTRFVMPIDINTGEIKIPKFFEDLTNEEKTQADIVNVRYYKYIKDKKEILKKASQKLKDKKIPDSDNPFELVLQELNFDSKEVSNNLF